MVEITTANFVFFKYVILGLRGSLYDPNDLKWAEQQGVTIITIDDYYNMGFERCIKKIYEVLDGCNTYLATFQLLKDFERDLHLHIHLENNILFPKAIKLEAKNNKL